MKKILFMLLFLSLNVFASSAQTFTQTLDDIKTLQAEFVQVVKSPKGEILQQSRGKMVLERPGKFRWETVSPQHQIIIVSDKKLMIVDEDLEQVTFKRINANFGGAPAILFSDHNNEIEKIFQVTEDKNTSMIASKKNFTLTPKNNNNTITKIKMTFMRNTLYEILIWDQLDHETQILFKNPKTNTVVPNNSFTLTIPSQYDVIDETKK